MSDEPIIAEIYESGIVRRSWRFRFISANNRKFGHNYNDWTEAREAIEKLVDPNVDVVLRLRHRNGDIWHLGKIRGGQ
ncbi:hypothetical protein NIIDNTM18_42790 [Mycolicibacterium litorale]|uniref:Uncharacterized protein n=1 Tax=Mycolicibacterium litorale TaxID=758802 RepID=A0A6S6PBA0_9MYCO|nr:hypothetical protein [Mycolicibacterium litorale]BCI55001.1 hypothetical protein NIIDNTM18_42790 [Mycolicibacterium litorale]